MAVKNFEEWAPYLNDVLAYWDTNGLPATGTVTIGGVEIARADILEMRDNFSPFDARIKNIERELQIQQNARVASSKEIQSFGVNFLAAMKGRFGASTTVAKNCPVVTKRRSSGARIS